LFAAVVEESSYVEAIVDRADPDAPIAPRPDLRRVLVPLGPVAVFGASNFPYAFSVAGGDTASARAAGCPVVVTAHPSHPGTSELVAAEPAGAVRDAGLPEGVLAMVHGHSSRVGQHLVEAAEAVTGQSCTKPGVVLVPRDEGGDAFVADVVGRLDEPAAGPVLNARIHAALCHAVGELDRDPDLRRVTGERDQTDGDAGGYRHAPVAFAVEAETVARRRQLLEERFGPFVLFVRCPDLEKGSQSSTRSPVS
jgi:acyl-CoA reductase-like NAD-dependent aldehyde dehydrogenase